MKLIKPFFEIIPQTDLFKHIELCGRVCYKSEDKITDNSAEKFVNSLIKSGHHSVLEHGTVYLKTVRYIDKRGRELGNKLGLTESDFSVPSKPGYSYDNKHYYFKYKDNPYSKLVDKSVDGIDIHYITTNYRVLTENGWLDDLKFQCEPTKYHIKRVAVRFILSRSIAQEYTRHRVFSFAMESQRYCAYNRNKFGNEVTFIIPCWFENRDNILGKWDGFKLGQWESIEENVKPKLFYEPYSVEDMYERVWILNCIQSEENYKMLLTDHKIESDRGPWTPQQAREVLPNACKTELIMTGFVSDWKDFFGLRCAPSAHPQAQELAIPLREEFIKLKLI